MNIKPIGKRVLIEKIQQEEKTTSGILLLATNTEKTYSLGKIISLSENPEIIEQFNVNDSIIFKNSSGFQINTDGLEFIMLDLDEILGVIENKKD